MSKSITFAGSNYTEASLNKLSGPELVELYNSAVEAIHEGENVPTVRRFSDKTAATTRTWKMLQRAAEHEEHKEAKKAEAAEKEQAPAPVKTTVTAKAHTSPSVVKTPKAKPVPPKGRASRGTNLSAPGHEPLACREGSKQAILVDMLSREEGATMDELLKALSGGNKPWTETTVRSGFGWDLKNKGYGVKSVFTAEGEGENAKKVERFHLVVPEGFAIPAHTPLKSAPKADARQGRLPEVK